MLNAFYELLDRIGYLHPIHPAMTHMPIGLVVAAFFISWAAVLSGHRSWLRLGYPLFVLAFLFWFPTVIFGYLDWQRYYAGAMLHPIIMKMILAGILFVLLLAGLVLGWKDRSGPAVMLTVYTLSFAVVTALGYYGGQVVYGGAAPVGPVAYRAGQHVFDSNCSGCHAHGGNVYAPNLPLRSAPQLANPAMFIAFLRHPVNPDGKPGIMPAFTPDRLSDQDAHALYQYIDHVIVSPKRN